ncbi:MULTISPECIES: Na/Pi cotransporter family protein [Mesorhizobium]|uniref:Phosphate:Na+ symporter n=1 Tax=Rhizobium loti TaxID=381 RepID=A0A8E2WG77_RHILI|nr:MULTISPECIES: Na/Pi cotransporter family protein [Mesorhizobium]PWJ93869.1 phosphate:Na+ symporter [Mesorhizobium loti]QKC82229.1 Na/Pi cotransporter family protein [Mesorhizobium sp. NZP2077]QKD15702.1 Na/Pi cotransporter family protein [Mesorhizobium sp. NZP2077]
MIDLIGAVALLLWGIRMVKTGVSRAFGARLRRWIAAATRNRLMAFGVGLAATMALQSSTATALMTASFAGSGFISSAMAQAIMLGANVGTSLVTRILAFDIHWLAPLMIAAGVVMFTFSEARPHKGIARAVLGLGLMLLSLHLLGQSTEPMRQSEVLRALMASLDAVPALAVVVAAVLPIASSSSLAIVLLVMSLAASGTVGPALGIALVLGANLGGAVPPVIATMGDGPLARRVTIGNLAVRLIGCVIVLPFADQAASALSGFALEPAQLVVDAHIGLNLLLAAIMLPLLGAVSWAMRRLLPEVPIQGGPGHLDQASLSNPAMALAGAVRETLRIGDNVTDMLQKNLEALRRNDTKLCADIAAMDDEVDRLHEQVKLYLSNLNRTDLDEDEAHRSAEIVSYAINLEHIGDIIEKNLHDLVVKKIRNQLTFSAPGAAEIEEVYAVTIANLRIAQSILVSGDAKLARRLVEAKVDIRYLEKRSADNHLNRLRDGQIESLQTSALHLDILRDLKRINAHIAAIAYPILKEAGVLSESRLLEIAKPAGRAS